MRLRIGFKPKLWSPYGNKCANQGTAPVLHRRQRWAFFAVAMQVAAHAAKQGRGKFAEEVRDLVDEAKRRQAKARRPDPRNPLVSVPSELTELLAFSQPDTHLADMVLPAGIDARLKRVLREYRQRHKLESHGLQPRRKLLLIGPPGCGKTMTAATLAGELHLPLYTVVLEALITRYLGETAAKLRQIFQSMERTVGVFLFDEFDAIGSERFQTNDVAELRRVLSSFLQLLEQNRSESLVIAATNNGQLLDSALFRRFDDVIEYQAPDTGMVLRLLKNRLALYADDDFSWTETAEKAMGLKLAEVDLSCDDALKEMVLDDRSEIDTGEVVQALLNRHAGQR